MSRLEAHAGFFRLPMKGIFDPYDLWPFDNKLIYQLVTHVRTRNYTVSMQEFTIKQLSFVSSKVASGFNISTWEIFVFFSYKIVVQCRHDLRCAIASCELRCAVANCDVRVRTHFVETCDVRACGAFLGLRCAIPTLNIFQQKCKMWRLECPFFWCILQFCRNLKQILTQKINFWLI